RGAQDSVQPDRGLAAALSLRHVPGYAVDGFLFAAAQFDRVAVGVADEHRDVTTFAETYGALGYGDVIGLQRGDRLRDRADPQGDMRKARILLADIHQDI